jgi:surface polysaccharide O-acyltransferase-like enzyme
MKRVVFLDYIRILACLMVIVVHASENFYGVLGLGSMAGPQSLLANEADRLWVSIYDGLSRMSVPLFIMVSAYLLVPLKEGLTMRAFYKRRAERVLVPFACFMVLYSVLPLLWGATDTATAIMDLKRLPLNFPTLAAHFWFMYPLIGLYLFMPIISPWLKSASRREEQFVILLFLISTCMPYLNHFFGDVWGQCFWNEYHLLWNFSGYIGYLVLAHYIRFHIDWDGKRRLMVGGALTIVGAVTTILTFYVQAIPGQILPTPVLELGWAFCTINCVALTVGAFLMLSAISLTQTPKWVADMSKMSFGIYLIHIFWIGMWVTLFKDQMAMPSAAAIPAISIATFICSYLTTKLISFIPHSRWIIG